MNRSIKLILSTLAIVAVTGCTRIPTGEIGLRINASNVTEPGELMPGSWNQTVIGSVQEFPVRDISGELKDIHPITSENVALAAFDLVYAYSINPNSVYELWTKKSRALHKTEDKGDVQLMRGYVEQTINSATFKALRLYPALKANDNRQLIETKIKELVSEEFKTDGLTGSLTLTMLQVRSMVPPASILDQAALLVKSANDLSIKTNEVQTATQEALRMSALSGSAKNIEYMQAQAQLNISEAIKNGKVNTIVVPWDFKGIVTVK